MAIPFKSPVPPHQYKVSTEKSALSKHFTKRKVPSRNKKQLLLASWNVANLGAQTRTPEAKALVAHILKRFDLIALQELNDKYEIIDELLKLMGPGFDYIMTDTAGNQERLAYIYRKRHVTPTNLFGELALRPREYPKRTVKVKWRDRGVEKVDTFKNLRFVPFDRNPFIGSFRCGAISFVLVNTHLYFGKFQNSRKQADRLKYARRVLEIYALSRWADRRANKDSTYDKNIILLGDMNVPTMDSTESTYKALIKFGWQPTDYTTRTGGSNIGNDKTYDQMIFAPGNLNERIKDQGVFDFDKAVFRSLWRHINGQFSPSKAVGKFNMHVKHHISDHRPLWVKLDIT
jgi:endonuclease/exonuclease/phosphatase family metal-dependent hydrolase